MRLTERADRARRELRALRPRSTAELRRRARRLGGRGLPVRRAARARAAEDRAARRARCASASAASAIVPLLPAPGRRGADRARGHASAVGVLARPSARRSMQRASRSTAARSRSRGGRARAGARRRRAAAMPRVDRAGRRTTVPPVPPSQGQLKPGEEREVAGATASHDALDRARRGGRGRRRRRRGDRALRRHRRLLQRRTPPTTGAARASTCGSRPRTCRRPWPTSPTWRASRRATRAHSTSPLPSSPPRSASTTPRPRWTR